MESLLENLEIIGYQGVPDLQHSPKRLKPICHVKDKDVFMTLDNETNNSTGPLIGSGRKINIKELEEDVKDRLATKLADPVPVKPNYVLYLHPNGQIRYLTPDQHTVELQKLLIDTRSKAWEALFKNDEQSAQSLAYILLRIDSDNSDGLAILEKLRAKFEEKKDNKTSDGGIILPF